ncbi:MAG: hypothetical protein ACTHU0_29940 [Kofleriaceae bacterium]
MTKYAELQRALAEAGARDTWIYDQKKPTARLLIALVAHLRSYLSVGERGPELVYLSKPETDKDGKAGDRLQEGDVLYSLHPDRRTRTFDVRLDVTVTLPEEGGHGLWALLLVRPLKCGRFEVSFEGIRGDALRVEVDPNDPGTFERFSEVVFNAVRDYYEAWASDDRPSAMVGFIRPKDE